MDNIPLNKTNEQLDRLGEDIVNYMKDFLVSNDKVHTGKLKESIKYDISYAHDKTEINIKSLRYMKQVDEGMEVKPYSLKQSYIDRLKFRGQNVPATDIYQKTIHWIINSKEQAIADAAAEDINDYIKNLFSKI